MGSFYDNCTSVSLDKEEFHQDGAHDYVRPSCNVGAETNILTRRLYVNPSCFVCISNFALCDLEFSSLPIGSVFCSEARADFMVKVLIGRCDFSPSGRGGALKSPANSDPEECKWVIIGLICF